MKKIPLLSGSFVSVDDEDFDFLMRWNWSVGSNGYPKRQCRIGGKNKTFYMHRVIMKVGAKHSVDHINGKKTENTKGNLRVCSHGQNMKNMRKPKNNTSGYKGVFFITRLAGMRKPWQSQITSDGKKMHQGYFATKEEAARAYDRAAKKHHGQFAKLNFPEAI